MTLKLLSKFDILFQLFHFIFIFLQNKKTIHKTKVYKKAFNNTYNSTNKRGRTFYSLVVTHYFLLVTRYWLLFTRYSLLFTPYSLLCTPYSLLFSRYSLLFPRYSLLFTFCLLLFARCSFVQYCIIFTMFTLNYTSVPEKKTKKNKPLWVLFSGWSILSAMI